MATFFPTSELKHQLAKFSIRGERRGKERRSGKEKERKKEDGKALLLMSI